MRWHCFLAGLPDWAVDTNYQGMAYLLISASRYTTPKVRVLIEHLVGALKPLARPLKT